MIKEVGRYPVEVWQLGRSKKPKLLQIETEIYGKLWAPENLVEFTNLIADLTTVAGSRVAWRGQSYIDWPVHSSAIRRILKYGWTPMNYAGLNERYSPIPYKGEVLAECLYEYEESLLHEARLRGHDYQMGKRLTDLELLAVLQHFGAATRLLDFSKNAFVALWFACYDHPEEYGIVFFGRMHTIHEKAHWINNSEDIKLPISDLLKKYGSRVLIWEPVHLFQRMKVQQGVFAFGEPVAKEWGSFPVNEVRGVARGSSDVIPGLIPIAISPSLKEEMKEYWGSIFGYDSASLFPELDGFSGYHGPESEFESYFGDREEW
jgi:hypothetical protein